jgi:hypothetical protein
VSELYGYRSTQRLAKLDNGMRLHVILDERRRGSSIHTEAGLSGVARVASVPAVVGQEHAEPDRRKAPPERNSASTVPRVAIEDDHDRQFCLGFVIPGAQREAIASFELYLIPP